MADEKVEQGQESKKRGKKINKMTVPDIQKKLEETKTAQGGHLSRYAKELLRRKETLSSKK